MDRLWRTDYEGVYVLVLHFSPENGRERESPDPLDSHIFSLANQNTE